MSISADHLLRCLETLDLALTRLQQHRPATPDYEVFRNAVIKGFDLTLEISGKLLRKALKAYGGTPKFVDELAFKDVFRQAAKHGLLEPSSIERWFAYLDNRNAVVHDYGVMFVEETLVLLPGFIDDARALARVLERKFRGDHGA